MTPPTRAVPKLPDTNKLPPASVPDKNPPASGAILEAAPASSSVSTRRISDLFR
jgi:hypothetical protein